MKLLPETTQRLITTPIAFPPVETRPIRFIPEDACIEGWKAIVNPVTSHTYYVATDSYKLIPHEKVIEQVESAIVEVPEYGQVRREIRLFNDGARMKATYRFIDVDYQIDRGDIVHPEIYVFNSYDQSLRLKILFGAFAVICSNGLVIGEEIFQMSKKHTKNLDIGSIHIGLVKGMEHFSDRIELWKSWVDRVLRPDEYEQVIKDLDLGKKEQEHLEDVVEVRSNLRLDDLKVRTTTLWIFFQLVMQFITHNIHRQMRQIELQERARKAFARF